MTQGSFAANLSTDWWTMYGFRLFSISAKRAGTQHPALIPSCRQMSAHPAKRACPSVRPLAGAFIVNFHAALRAAPPRMKARIAPRLRQSTLPLRSVLNKRSTFHFGRCWTRATGTQQHWRLAPRNPAQRYVYVPLRSALNAWSTLRSGRCWTSATGA